MVQSFCSFRSRSQKRTGVFSGNKKLHFVEQTVVFCEGGLTTNRFGQASLCRLFLVSIASSSKKNMCLAAIPVLVGEILTNCLLCGYKMLQAFVSFVLFHPWHGMLKSPVFLWRGWKYSRFRRMAAKCPWIIRHGLRWRAGSWLVRKWHTQSVNLTSKTGNFLNNCVIRWCFTEKANVIIRSIGFKLWFQTFLTFATLGYPWIIGDIGTAIVFSAPSASKTALIVWNANLLNSFAASSGGIVCFVPGRLTRRYADMHAMFMLRIHIYNIFASRNKPMCLWTWIWF
jgi:hypothetical protein